VTIARRSANIRCVVLDRRMALALGALVSCGGTNAVPLADGGATCPSVAVVDALTSERASCSFAAGAMPLETLAISAERRAEIPIRHVIVLMKENS